MCRARQPPFLRSYSLGPLTLDAQSHDAYWNGQPLGLTLSEFAILELLTRAAGRVVSRDELSAVLHHRETTPFERSIDVHVSHLRKKLDAAGHSIIKTVRGVGYLCSVDT